MSQPSLITPHMERVFEKYRQEGREQILAYLTQKGVIRETMIGTLAAHLVETPKDPSIWPIIDLPKDIAAWVPKKEETND